MLWSQVVQFNSTTHPFICTCKCFIVVSPSTPAAGASLLCRSISCSALRRTAANPPEESPPPAPNGQGSAAAASLIDLEGEGEGAGEGWAAPAADEESGVLRGEFENLWPLQLVDLRDDEMIGTLFRLLRRLPQVPSYAFLAHCTL